MNDDPATLAVAPPVSPTEGVPDSASSVGAKDLVNLLNYVNFCGGRVTLQFVNPQKWSPLVLEGYPQPVLEDTLVCRWTSPGAWVDSLAGYLFQELLVGDGQVLVSVLPEVLSFDHETIVLRLPEFGLEKTSRRSIRHPAQGIDVEVFQSGLRFFGTLVDFNSMSFLIDVSRPASGSFHGLNLEAPAMVLFERRGTLLYSEECRFVRRGGTKTSFILAPVATALQRLRKKEFRSLRHHLTPAPLVWFEHPLTGKTVSLRTHDLSSLGFSVDEFLDDCSLVPGLILPEVTLELGNQTVLKGAAQVLYRRELDEGARKSVRFGAVFLDLGLADQARLAALLHQTANGHLRVCGPVDMDELWRFFFESGFLYPSKYLAIENARDEFRRVYEKVYLNNLEISRHFLFQDKGVLFGHMSMIRAYPKAWLVHHHAASRSGHGLAGVAVLEQISDYINEFHALRSTRMDYVLCYYRRENRFPHRVFGGTYEDVGNRKGISLDTFAYFYLPPPGDQGSLPFQIFPASRDDLIQLGHFYEATSGGLMLAAMNLEVPTERMDELSEQYRRVGFRHEHLVFSVKINGDLKAVVTLSLTNLGLNLSNLTNCLHVLVIDATGLQASVLFHGLSQLVRHYTEETLPVLLFPPDYLSSQSVSYEKEYTLWVLDMAHDDGYMKSIHKRFRRLSHG